MSVPPPPAHGAYALAFKLDRDCLRAHVSGSLTSLAQILAMFFDVASEVRRTAATKMLMVDDTLRDVPDADQFRLLVQAVEGAGFAGVRLAYVDPRGGHVVRLQQNELVAIEHGYVLRMFDDESRALIWLRHGVD